MSRPESNFTPTNRASPSPGVSVQGVVVFVGFITFFIALIIFICCCTLRLSRRHEQVNGASGPNAGLDREVLLGLPVFVHSCEGGKKLECAVCLEEFEEGEKGRVLPSCDHRFHVECIDMWLHSHSSCPLCRAAVKVETSGSNIV